MSRSGSLQKHATAKLRTYYNDITGLQVVPGKGKPHAYDITLENFIKRIPVTLALDTQFLRFYFGDAYIGDPEWFTNECMFPNLCMPKFRFKIFVSRRGKDLTLTYKCYCHNTFSLFCQALRAHVIPKWVKMVKTMMRQAELMERSPKYYVMPYGRSGISAAVDDPIYGGSFIGAIYRILMDEKVEGHVKIDRTDNVITIRISGIDRAPWTVTSYVGILERYGDGLSKNCKVIVEFYPFIRAVCKGRME